MECRLLDACLDYNCVEITNMYKMWKCTKKYQQIPDLCSTAYKIMQVPTSITCMHNVSGQKTTKEIIILSDIKRWERTLLRCEIVLN